VDNKIELDIIDRLARLETKVDIILQNDKKRFDMSMRTTIALIGSATATILAIWF
jgi:hypothetical protein